MRIVRFEHQGRIQFGARRGSHVAPFAGLAGGSFAALLAGLRDGTPLPEAEAVAQTQVNLLPPVPLTGKIICIGLNYADHAREGGHPIPTYPAVFLRTATSLVGHGQPLSRPMASDRFDYEAELAVVIGRTARHVHAAEALDFVAGYSCFNDGSLRDFQRKSTQWTMGKNFDKSGSIGPELVTQEALPSGVGNLRIAARLNGETLQDGSTGDMIFPVPDLIEILSAVMTLDPGDVIATGTPAGVGFARTPPRFMQAGDLIEIEIEGIGILANTIVDEASGAGEQEGVRR
ncbi:fumarylacetoacetate hydrolase family protein [Xanthobacter wiegelii]|uniref:fumarylacetoacetate hydrolase family protein n=1 Tax=Xanthobacter wiegelii TaxID=3119913 RepID=UPI0037276C3D